MSVPDHPVAIVGGGSAGIGRATGRALALAGHDVVLVGRHAEALQRAADELADETGREVGAIVHDLSRPAAASDFLDAVTERHGTPAVLVLNAGGPRPGRVGELGDDDWRTATDLLLIGPLRLAALALPTMADRGFGRVVTVTSTAVRQPQPGLAASVVLRAAATAAMKLLSLEFAASNVTVNCVAPGATATARRAEIIAARAASGHRSVEQLDQEDAAEVPAGRAGTPAEIADAIAFLASPAASYINGTVLTVDGGRTVTI